MRKLNIILAITILWLNSIFADSLTVILDSPSQVDSIRVDSQGLDTFLVETLEDLRGQGYWNASLDLMVAASDSTILHAILERGEVISISNIHFKNVSEKDEIYLHHEFTMGSSEISVEQIPTALQRVNSLGYRFSDREAISRDESGMFHLNYNVTKKPELNAELLASFSQNKTSDSLKWHGHINIHVPNIDGRGKSLSLFWKRLNQNSESFKFGYQHPWMLNMPLKGILQFGREVIEGNYQVLETSLGLDWSMGWEKSLIFSFVKSQTLITHEGALNHPGWLANNKRLLGLGYRQTNLNYQLHRGLSLKTSLFQELNFEPAAVRKFVFRWESELPLPGAFFFSQRSAGTIQNIVSSESDPSIQLPIGGVASVRGYEENVIRSASTTSIQNNLILEMGLQSQLLMFTDFGLYFDDSSIKTLQGYGVGVKLRSGRGPIQLIVASHAGLDMKNSYLHIEYSGGVPWIDR